MLTPGTKSKKSEKNVQDKTINTVYLKKDIDEIQFDIEMGKIKSEKQKKIFNRFEKLNENAQGTGLGLSICQLIIEQLGGSIWIDPDYEEGSRFLFTHPIDKSDQGKEETR